MPQARTKKPLGAQYKPLEDVSFPNFNSSSNSASLSQLPLHLIFPRRKAPKPFNHHKTTAAGKAYEKKAKKKAKSRWYIEELASKRKRAAAASKPRNTGNEWIRQRVSSPSVETAEKNPTKKYGTKTRQSSDVAVSPSAMTSTELEEQRQMRRKPWRYQSGQARRQSLLNPHKRITGLWDPAADMNSRNMEPMLKSEVLALFAAQGIPGKDQKYYTGKKVRTWLASRAFDDDDTAQPMLPILPHGSKMSEFDDEIASAGLGRADFVTPMAKRKNRIEIVSAQKYLESKLGNTETDKQQSESAKEILAELREQERLHKEKTALKKDALKGGSEGWSDDDNSAEEEYGDDDEAESGNDVEAEPNVSENIEAAGSGAAEVDNEADDDYGNDDDGDYGNDDDDYGDDYGD